MSYKKIETRKSKKVKRNLTNKGRYRKLTGGVKRNRHIGETEAQTGPRETEALVTELEELDERELKKRFRQEQKLIEAGKKAELEKFTRLHATLPQERKSSRVCGISPIPTKNVIEDTKGYEGYHLVSREEMEHFVKRKIHDGPQKVTLVVGDQSHAILVDVQPSKIMISDWKGPKFVNSRYEPRYRNYNELVDFLKEKYDLPIVFYPIDPYLLSVSEGKSKKLGNLGGCSEYNDLWAKVYYKKGHFEYPFNE
jgi:hypothetical protein